MTNEQAVAFVAALVKGNTAVLLAGVMGYGKVAEAESFRYHADGLSCDLAEELVGQLEDYTERLRSMVGQNRKLLEEDAKNEKDAEEREIKKAIAAELPFAAPIVEREVKERQASRKSKRKARA